MNPFSCYGSCYCVLTEAWYTLCIKKKKTKEKKKEKERGEATFQIKEGERKTRKEKGYGSKDANFWRAIYKRQRGGGEKKK